MTWWVGEDPLADVARQTLSPRALAEVQAWLVWWELANRRRCLFGHLCTDCRQPRGEKSHGAYLRCGPCAARRREAIRKSTPVECSP